MSVKLLEGSNTVNVQMMPLNSPVTFTGISGVLRSPTGVGSNWNLAEITLSIRNDNDIPISQGVAVYFGATPEVDTLTRIWNLDNVVWLPVELEPGQSMNLVQPHEFIVPGQDPYVYGTVWNAPSFGVGDSYYFKALDSLGSESNLIVLNR